MIDQNWINKLESRDLDFVDMIYPMEEIKNINIPNIATHLSEYRKEAFFRESLRRFNKRSNIDDLKTLTHQYFEHISSEINKLKFSGFENAYFKKTSSKSEDKQETATLLWYESVFQKLKKPIVNFHQSLIDENFLKELRELSNKQIHIKVVKDYLEKIGICFVVEDVLPAMKLDGAAFIYDNSFPVIALTLRYKRIDNFWFALFHELGHLKFHIDTNRKMIFDSLFDDDSENAEIDFIEEEANIFARDALIPRDVWKRSRLAINPSKKVVEEVAKELGISALIVVGRLRHERKEFHLFQNHWKDLSFPFLLDFEE